MTEVGPSILRSGADSGAGFGASMPSWIYIGAGSDAEDALFSVAVLDDGAFRFEGFNPAAERLTGLQNRDLIGRSPEQALPAANAAVVTARYRQCVMEGRALSYLETLEFPTGRSDWRTTLQPVADASGRIVRLLGRARQIEQINATQEELTEAEFHKALDLFPLGFAVLDARGVIRFVNRAWRRFSERFGGTVDEVGSTYVEVCASPNSVALPDGPEVAVKLRLLISGETDHFSVRYAWGQRHFTLRATRILLNGKLRIAMAHQDVTDMANAQELIVRSAEHLLVAQEEERARVALELHDSTSQHLVALGLGLAKLRRSGAPPQVMEDMRRSLTEAHREIRTLSYLLYPPKLSSQGLLATLRSFVEGFRRRTGLTVTTTTFGPLDEMPVDAQLTLLRVVQEALANAHRHAGARRVAIEVVLKKRGLRLTIADNGQVGTPGDQPQPTGVGIRGMQARFAKLGGRLTVTHRAFGTVVDGHLPPLAVRSPDA